MLACEADRAGLYNGFAALFSDPPAAADIAEWRAQGRIAPLAALHDDPELGEAAQHAFRILESRADAEDMVSRLNRAFCALFLGVNGIGRAAPPYESAYEGETLRLHGAASDAMEALLRGHGLRVADGCHEPPDHLALELAFTETLVRGGAPMATGAGEFLESHLLAWLPAFAARCAAYDDTGFYAAISALLGAFLQCEQQRLARCLPADSLTPVMED